MKRIRNIITFAAAAIAALAAPAQTIDENLCDPDANTETRQLYSYLRNEIWGKKVLSGVQSDVNYNTLEAERLQNLCGKSPKINIFDFQDHNADWCDYRGDAARRWKDAGGIVGFIWHWKIAKTPFSGPRNKRGFYAPGQSGETTYFRPALATVEGTLENKVLMEDLAAVADLLLYYQQQGIPVIWRPFHEGAGNSANSGSGDGAWFWWGVDGPGAYKRLWNYVQDYLWSRGVHNLIYVWTSQLNDHTWYPGPHRVDIVARDNYAAAADHNSRAGEFNILRTVYPGKMACLAECGYVPSADAMAADNAMWLFVAPWYGTEYIPDKNPADFWQTFMNHPSVVTR